MIKTSGGGQDLWRDEVRAWLHYNAVVVTCIVDAGDKLKSYGRFHVPEFVSVDVPTKTSIVLCRHCCS